MSKTTAPRVRQTNLYTVESDGQPVAQALAISQAEAVRLYVESVQQPTMSARLSSPLEARTLAGLPLLTRGEPVRDEATPDLFEGAAAAPGADPVLLATYCPPVDLADHVGDAAEMVPADHFEGFRAMVEPLASGGFAPCGRALGDCCRASQTCGRDGCGVEVVEMPPQHAPIAAVLEDLASGEQMPSALSTAAPTAAPAHAGADAPHASADAPTLPERMASAYAAGVEIARQGHTRWSTAFLDADAAALSGLRDAAADFVHAEMLRGFHDGEAQARRLFDEVPNGSGKVPVKYRNPETGESWTGRGLKPRWLVLAIEGGKALTDFLI